MRKRIINQGTQGASLADDQGWLDVEHLVQVELTSEDAEHPIESALIMNGGSGWRAQQPGKQTIRLLFDKPHRIRRIQLAFQEDDRERTQEFVLRWSADGGASCREIVRQQYNFSPPGMTRELEDYVVDLDGLTMLELSIIPDISGGEARAALAQLRLA
ncbi:MAG: carbohydrate-binding protein [Thiogranum sp.]